MVGRCPKAAAATGRARRALERAAFVPCRASCGISWPTTRRLRLIQHLPDDSLLHLCALAAPTTLYPKNRESTAVLHALLDVARRAGLTQLAVPATRLRQSLFSPRWAAWPARPSPPPRWRDRLSCRIFPYVALEAGAQPRGAGQRTLARAAACGGNASLEVLRQALRDTWPPLPMPQWIPRPNWPIHPIARVLLSLPIYPRHDTAPDRALTRPLPGPVP